MKVFGIATALFFSICGSVSAQSVKTETEASNGVQLTIHRDDFAGRSEITAPSLSAGPLGFAFVATITQNGKPGPLMIVGSVSYSGEWRYYNSAILRGGEAVEGIFNDRDVVSCRGSRYSGCSLREGFQLLPSAEQIEKYALNGMLSIQLRARSGAPVVLEIPVSHIEAVIEAAGSN
ncbi:MAG: hypothetical protein VX512_12395 [Pseudomonadota bacterium]|nr:hypothetical protein [Pseudomonadota bacterium]